MKHFMLWARGRTKTLRGGGGGRGYPPLASPPPKIDLYTPQQLCDWFTFVKTELYSVMQLEQTNIIKANMFGFIL